MLLKPTLPIKCKAPWEGNLNATILKSSHGQMTLGMKLVHWLHTQENRKKAQRGRPRREIKQLSQMAHDFFIRLFKRTGKETVSEGIINEL